MNYKKKIGILIGTTLGSLVTSTAILSTSIAMSFKENINNKIIINENNSNKIYNILATCITPKSDITIDDLNNESIKTNIKEKISKELGIEPTTILDINFENVKNTLFNVTIIFSDNVNVEENELFNVKTSSTIITANPINFGGIILLNETINENLFNAVKNYLIQNNNSTINKISTGDIYNSLIVNLNNIADSVLFRDESIVNVEFYLKNENTQVDFKIIFNSEVNSNTVTGNFTSTNNEPIISSTQTIDSNIYAKIDASKVDFQQNTVNELISNALKFDSNNITKFINDIQQDDNMKQLLSRATTMNFLDNFTGCEANLIDNAVGQFFVKLTNSSLGGNIFIEFNVTLVPSEELFIFNNDFTSITGLTDLGKQQSIIDLTPYTFLTSISDNCFSNSSNLESIKLPNSITIIGDSAFLNCINLNSIDLSNTNINIISNSCFENCNNLRNVLLPSIVTDIKDYAFKNCESLENINLSNIKTIGVSSFENSGKLNSSAIDLNNVILIGESAFKGSKIQELKWSATQTTIPAFCFDNCENLYYLEVNPNINIIGESAFNNCEKLENPFFRDGYSDSITEIGDNAFNNCVNFAKNDLVLNNVVTIGVNSFTNSQTINLSQNNNINTTLFNQICSDNPNAYFIYPNSFINDENNIINLADNDGSIVNVSGNTLTINLDAKPDAFIVTYKPINNRSFSTSTINEIVFSTSTLSKLRILDFSKFVGNFTSLTKITNIPCSITMVDFAFAYCSNNLEQITFEGQNTNLTSTKKSNLRLIKNSANEQRYAFSVKKLYLPFNCDLIDTQAFSNAMHSANIYYGSNKLIEINIPDSIKNLESNIFFNYNLETVNFSPNSTLTTISRNAFEWNGHLFSEPPLKNFIFPKTLEVIDDYAFRNNINFSSASWESIKNTSLTTLGSGCFEKRDSYPQHLNINVEFPSTLTKFGDGVFSFGHNSAAYSDCSENLTIKFNSIPMPVVDWNNFVYISHNTWGKWDTTLKFVFSNSLTINEEDIQTIKNYVWWSGYDASQTLNFNVDFESSSTITTTLAQQLLDNLKNKFNNYIPQYVTISVTINGRQI